MECNGKNRPLVYNGRLTVAPHLLDDAQSFTNVTGRLLRHVVADYHLLLREPWIVHFPRNVLGIAIQRPSSLHCTDFCATGSLEHGRASCQEIIKKDVFNLLPENRNPTFQVRRARAEFLNEKFRPIRWPPDFQSRHPDSSVDYCSFMIRHLGEFVKNDFGHDQPHFRVMLCDRMAVLCEGLRLTCVRELKADLISSCEDKAHAYARREHLVVDTNE